MGRYSIGRKHSKVPSRDGRSADAVLLRRTKAALTAHVGGAPSVTQRALIDRASMLTVHIARMDAKAIEDGGFSDWASRQYLAWSNSLARVLKDLGMKSTPAAIPDLAEYLRERTG